MNFIKFSYTIVTSRFGLDFVYLFIYLDTTRISNLFYALCIHSKNARVVTEEGEVTLDLILGRNKCEAFDI